MKPAGRVVHGCGKCGRDFPANPEKGRIGPFRRGDCPLPDRGHDSRNPAFCRVEFLLPAGRIPRQVNGADIVLRHDNGIPCRKGRPLCLKEPFQAKEGRARLLPAGGDAEDVRAAGEPEVLHKIPHNTGYVKEMDRERDPDHVRICHHPAGLDRPAQGDEFCSIKTRSNVPGNSQGVAGAGEIVDDGLHAGPSGTCGCHTGCCPGFIGRVPAVSGKGHGFFPPCCRSVTFR